MSLKRRLKREMVREAQKDMPPGLDEKQLLMIRLGQKDVQLFQLELILQQLHTENAGLKQKIAVYEKVRGPNAEGEAGEATSVEGTEDVPTAAVAEGEGVPSAEN